MPAARNGAIWSIMFLVALFLAGAWAVMIAPLATGDLYPPYSSFRTDPLGAKALFESLSEQPGLDVTRLYKARPPLDRETTLLILGVDSVGWSSSPKPAFDDYETLLKNGGRIVIAFLPARAPEMPPNTAALQEQWHIRPRYRKVSGRAQRDSGTIPREAALYFEPGKEWRVLQSRRGDAAIVERDLTGGTLVLIGDSFPLSNQGLSEASDGALIAQLVGTVKRVLFDENQFGVSETGSVALLLRKYHLEAALAMLLAVAGLSVWRNTSTFLPPREAQRSSRVTGRDSHEGLAALLRRNIPEDRLLSECWKEWTRSASRRDSQQGRAEMVLAEIENENGKQDPVAGYRAACRALAARGILMERK
jgi:hypothetical protein